LALKWRPQVFADLVGQEAVTRTLQNAIRSGRLAHAYIFAGPRGVGKTTTARLFAKTLNCRSPKDAEPCNACDICQEISQGNSLDVIEFDAAAHNSVDDIRRLQEVVANMPAKSKYKVYIFDEAHRMAAGAAFDAFLKTLEEPPEHVYFILCSTEIHKFPATIQSRCQRYEFRAMGMDTLIKQLEKICHAEQITADPKALHLIARSAGGSMRDAQRTLDQIVAYCGKKVSLEDVRQVLGTVETEALLQVAEAAVKEDAPAALLVVKNVFDSGKDLEQFYQGILETFRHLVPGRNRPDREAFRTSRRGVPVFRHEDPAGTGTLLEAFLVPSSGAGNRGFGALAP
jgi:DNA polymerase-3 subunit gamma/tau